MKMYHFVLILASLVLVSLGFMAGCGNPTGGGGGGGTPFSADIYVSTTGSDEPPNGDGSLAKPYRTIQKGLNEAGTGEVVGVLAGLYVEAVKWPVTYEGITLRGISRDTAILSGEAGQRCISIEGIAFPQMITIENMTIRNGYANGNGGGISLQEHNITMHLRNVKLLENRTDSNGAGLYMRYSDDKVIIQDSIFSGNRVTTNSPYGGGIYQALGSLLIIDDTEFSSNYGGNGGGDIFSSGILEVSNCNIHDNSAFDYGGALYFASGAVPHIINSTIEGNDVPNAGNGGGIYSEGVVATIEGCTFRGNHSFASGGGVKVDGGNGNTTFFNKCRFYDNHAQSGGAISANNMIDLEKCLYVNNTAETSNGGALYLTASGSAEIVNCIFKSNKANSEGGGIYANGWGNEIEIYNCTFVTNEAGGAGSAMEIVNGNGVSINNSIFWFNKKGGGMYEIDSGGGSYDISYCNYESGAITGSSTGSHDTFTAPTFESYPNDLHLANDCTTEVTQGGTSAGAPSDDYDDVTRTSGNGYSMGAYEKD